MMTGKNARGIAADLVMALTSKGFAVTAHVYNEFRENPCVAVLTLGEPVFIYVAPDGDGEWHYWWGESMTTIAPHTEPGKAAALIEKDLLGMS